MADAYSFNTGSSQGSSTSGTQVLPELMGVYQQLLGLNQNRYSNVLSAYQNQAQSTANQLPGIYGGYGQVQNQVMGTLGLNGGGWGVAAPAAAAINRQFVQQQGQTDQQLINAGLGNSTIRGSLQGQNSYNAGQAYGNLGAQLAQTAAGYQSQFGLARQGAMMQGLGMQNQLGAGLGGALAGMQFGNTAGGLTGGYSTSNQMSQNYGTSRSIQPGGYGGGGSYGSPTSGLTANQLFGNGLGQYGTDAGMSTVPGYAGYGNYTPYTPASNSGFSPVSVGVAPGTPEFEMSQIESGNWG